MDIIIRYIKDLFWQVSDLMNNQDEIAYYREEDCCNSKKKDLVLFDPDLVSCSNHEYFDYYSSDEDDPD